MILNILEINFEDSSLVGVLPCQLLKSSSIV